MKKTAFFLFSMILISSAFAAYVPGIFSPVPFYETDGVSKSVATTSTALNSLLGNSYDYQYGDQIDIAGQRPDGTIFSLQFSWGSAGQSYDGTTLGDLIDFLNGSLAFDSVSPQGATVFLSSGRLFVLSNISGREHMPMLAIQDDAANIGVTNWSRHQFLPYYP